MSHVRQQIRDRIATLVTGLPLTGTRVYKMRSYALDKDKLPALLVYTLNETSSLITIGTRTLRRNLNVAVEAIASGTADIHDTVDAICVDVEEAIAADFSLSGLVKSCVLTNTEIDVLTEGERPISSARLTFDVQYVTAIDNVETAR